MAHQTQLSFVSLQVSDLDASRQFYTEVLSFKLLPKSPPDALVFEQKNGATFAIRKPLVDLSKTALLGWGVSLWFGVSDLDAFLTKIKGKTPLVKDVQQTPFGRTVVIADPDGYWLTIQETKE